MSEPDKRITLGAGLLLLPIMVPFLALLWILGWIVEKLLPEWLQDKMPLR